MKKLFLSMVIGGVLAAACSSEEAPPASVVEPAADEPATPGALPPPVEFAQDGDVIRAKVGDEFSILLDLPGDVDTTAVLWHNVDGAYEPVAEQLRTYRTFEGELRYSDVVVKALAPGETTLVFQPIKAGAPFNDDRRTISLIVED